MYSDIRIEINKWIKDKVITGDRKEGDENVADATELVMQLYMEGGGGGEAREIEQER